MKSMAILFCIAVVAMSATPTLAQEYHGIPVTALGQASLSVYADSLEVHNCISGTPETDGCRFTFADTFDHWECEIENPDPYNAAPVGASIQVDYVGDLDGVPDQLLGSVGHVKLADYEYGMAVDLRAETYTVAIYDDAALVFYGEGIPDSQLTIIDEGKLHGFLKIRWPWYWIRTRVYNWWNHHHGHTYVCRFSGPGPAKTTVTWDSQGLTDLEFTDIEITGEFPIAVPVTRPRTASIYATGIEEFQVLEMQAAGVPLRVPTLSEWGLAVLGLLVLAAGGLVVRLRAGV